MKGSRLKGILLTVTAGIVWGINGIVGQYLFSAENMDSGWLVPVRMLLAGLILLVYCLFRYGKQIFEPWRSQRERTELFLYGIAGIGACQFFYFTAIQKAGAAAATILQDLSPVFILLIECRIARRWAKPYEIISILLALSGLFLMVTHGSRHSLSLPVSALFSGIMAAVCASIYNTVPRTIVRKYPVLILQGWAFFLSGIVFSLLLKPFSSGYVPSLRAVLLVLLAVFLGNIFAFSAYIKGTTLISPEKAILYAFSEPVSAAILSVLFLGSHFTWFDVAGFALIFAALAVLSAAGNDHNALP